MLPGVSAAKPRPAGAVEPRGVSAPLRAGGSAAPAWWTPIRIVIAYAVVAILWIAFSDRVLVDLVSSEALREEVQTVKGAGFVLATSVLLLFLIRRSEASVRALGAELRATVDGMADGVLLVDAAAEIIEANRAAAGLFGVESPRELLGPVSALGERARLRTLDGAPVPAERFATVRALSGEVVPAYDAVFRRVDGREVFVSISAAPVVVEGRPPLAVAVLRDVTAAKRLDDIREEFLSTAAHELKTPLAVIKAYAQLMQRREPSEVHTLTVIQRQVDRLTRLVQQLLDASRLRLEPDPTERPRLDLAALAQEEVERLRPVAPTHALTFEAAGPAPVRGERERLRRVLASLLDNAVRYSPQGGPVETRVDVRGDEVVVSVRDRGLGIPADRQDRIFERYYRAHAGTGEDRGGLGLGLGTALEIVTRHGGRMWFESAPGVGSTFHFSLPLAVERPA